jgi:hypothetical protein
LKLHALVVICVCLFALSIALRWSPSQRAHWLVGLVSALAQQARQRYEARQIKIDRGRQASTQADLQSKAEMKLADLATHTRFNAEPTTGEAMSAVDADKEMVSQARPSLKLHWQKPKLGK